MASRDSNNATWFWLGYPADFASQPTGPYRPDLPLADPSVFYDADRHVLELLPTAPETELGLLESLAVGINGERYQSEIIAGAPQITLSLCDGRRVLVCDPFVFAGPRGLGIDRRGFLYVADARAVRIVVIDTATGSVQAVLGHPALREPVDVAIHPGGWVIVADRGGVDNSGTTVAGSILVFDASMRYISQFIPRNAEDLPAKPRPRAVMVEGDGTIAVADGSHPRLLHFTLGGEPLADLPVPTPSETVEPSCHVLPAGICDPCRPSDIGVVLADIHRSVRRRSLSLASSYQAQGVVITRALDSGVPGTQWHRVEAHAVVPAGTQLTIEMATAEELTFFDPTTAAWNAPADADGGLISFTGSSMDLDDPSDNQLAQAKPGRFAWLQITLRGDGTATPSLSAVRILYPRFTYLALLPRVFRQDPDSDSFLQQFLALFELVATGVEDRYEAFSRLLDPAAATIGVINWLACLIDLAFDPSWSLERRRELVAAAVELYKFRGTSQGLSRFIEIYTGQKPVLEELFLERPGAPVFLGNRGAILGCTWLLSPPSAHGTPAEALFENYAHRFRVIVYELDPCAREVMAAVLDRIVSVNRPAHTVYTIVWVGADARVGLQTRVGVDFVLGAREIPSLLLASDEASGNGGILGLDTIVGAGQPGYVRPLGLEI